MTSQLKGLSRLTASAVVAGVVMSGLVGLVAAQPASAGGGYPGGGGGGASGGNGTYTVSVTLTGNGVGSGGDLGSPGSGSSTSVTVKALCGYTSSGSSQASEESMWRNDDQLIPWLQKTGQTVPKDGIPTDDQVKAFIIHEANLGYNPQGVGYEVRAWNLGIVANWGKSGMWYIDGCTGTQSDAYFANFSRQNPPQLSGNGTAPVPRNPPVDPRVLLRAAQAAMTLPHVLSVGINPSGRTYVTLPTYVWANEQNPGIAPGYRTVTASVNAPGARQFATVRATYKTTLFVADPSGVGCAGGNGPAKSYSHGQPFACMQFTSAAPQVTVTGTSVWPATAHVCTITGGGYGCTNPAVPTGRMAGQGQITVDEIQTLDR